jgi:16S rRNA (guanine(1405)-N(7))-methyltransferase
MPDTTSPSNDPTLTLLLHDILSSSKYKDVCSDLIADIGARELQKRRSLKEAIKATKNKLHQVSAAYLVDPRQEYASWLQNLRMIIDDKPADLSINKYTELKNWCRTTMSHHASTRERLPILDDFYPTLFSHLPPIHSILDLACGLNPLALPWMPLSSDITYYACDIYHTMMVFLQDYMNAIGLTGQTFACDVLTACPTTSVDVAFLLKTLPCLEQINPQAILSLLERINARYLVISYPLHSLGGHGKGMHNYYETHFQQLLTNQPWPIQTLTFPNELVFLVQKAP